MLLCGADTFPLNDLFSLSCRADGTVEHRSNARLENDVPVISIHIKGEDGKSWSISVKHCGLQINMSHLLASLQVESGLSNSIQVVNNCIETQGIQSIDELRRLIYQFQWCQGCSLEAGDFTEEWKTKMLDQSVIGRSCMCKVFLRHIMIGFHHTIPISEYNKNRRVGFLRSVSLIGDGSSSTGKFIIVLGRHTIYINLIDKINKMMGNAAENLSDVTVINNQRNKVLANLISINSTKR